MSTPIRFDSRLMDPKEGQSANPIGRFPPNSPSMDAKDAIGCEGGGPAIDKRLPSALVALVHMFATKEGKEEKGKRKETLPFHNRFFRSFIRFIHARLALVFLLLPVTVVVFVFQEKKAKLCCVFGVSSLSTVRRFFPSLLFVVWGGPSDPLTQLRGPRVRPSGSRFVSLFVFSIQQQSPRCNPSLPQKNKIQHHNMPPCARRCPRPPNQRRHLGARRTTFT